MSEMEHREIPIFFDPKSGKFTCTVQGEEIEKGSLATIKKEIDKRRDTKFDEFQAVNYHRSSKFSNKSEDGFDTFKIVKHRQQKRKWGSNYSYFVDHLDNSHESVIVDTPENRKTLLAMAAHRDETDRLATTRKAELTALHAKLLIRNARDYGNPLVKENGV